MLVVIIWLQGASAFAEAMADKQATKDGGYGGQDGVSTGTICW